MSAQKEDLYKHTDGRELHVYARANPLLDVVWCHTGTPSPKASENDDFVGFTSAGHTLRVEQMDKGAWWWQVYTLTNVELNPGGTAASSKERAFDMAELACWCFERACRECAALLGVAAEPPGQPLQVLREDASGLSAPVPNANSSLVVGGPDGQGGPAEHVHLSAVLELYADRSGSPGHDGYVFAQLADRAKALEQENQALREVGDRVYESAKALGNANKARRAWEELRPEHSYRWQEELEAIGNTERARKVQSDFAHKAAIMEAGGDEGFGRWIKRDKVLMDLGAVRTREDDCDMYRLGVAVTNDKVMGTMSDEEFAPCLALFQREAERLKGLEEKAALEVARSPQLSVLDFMTQLKEWLAKPGNVEIVDDHVRATHLFKDLEDRLTAVAGTRLGPPLGYFMKAGGKWWLAEVDGGNLVGYDVTPLGKLHTLHIHRDSVDQLVILDNER
ncbi:MAG TPA: hypothetical protein PLB89_04945 [Flavobacteriales bacterium]|nr:hypothetical protein [Flavobacteriales bacterium]